MTQKQAIQLFEERKVRTVWDDETEKWYFAIVDVVAILTESADAAAYWRKLKQRLKAEGNETVTNCHGLKMLAADGKMRLTDVADTSRSPRRRPNLSNNGWRRSPATVWTRCRTPKCPSSRQWPITNGWDIPRIG